MYINMVELATHGINSQPIALSSSAAHLLKRLRDLATDSHAAQLWTGYVLICWPHFWERLLHFLRTSAAPAWQVMTL